jgi:hypothetical protein
MLACRGGHGAVVQVLITAKVGLNIRNQVRPLSYCACYNAACTREHTPYCCAVLSVVDL